MFFIPIGSMYATYMVLHGSHQYTPVMLAYFYQHHGSVMGLFLAVVGDVSHDGSRQILSTAEARNSRRIVYFHSVSLLVGGAQCWIRFLRNAVLKPTWRMYITVITCHNLTCKLWLAINCWTGFKQSPV